jgi:heme exporter protein A
VIVEVRLRGVTKTYGAATALRGVTLDIASGLTVVEGPNGSGKSTLLGVIGQVTRPTKGTIEYLPVRHGSAARAELGWLSHDSLCYGDLTGKQSVLLAARLAGVMPDQAWEVARERFELGSFAERKLRTNSRGQRQRVALARALSSRPSVLLLDEPTTGLDKRSTERLVHVVAEELKHDLVIVLVTHEPETFRDLRSSKVVLDGGRATLTSCFT